ncbi:bifunctional glycosyltransferase/CDP-glycerol:glycerophosphate glycerophosphotransferase [Actinomadura xylanilytica]|uniref:bifunctional glycosyltransferase/CDP-glycerol:glycerophosphate glycerophosphotransferase n=1 Tax=Actinomadura xylanilytica TaxID=887459 RepID=UPI00255AA114|nr:bifunctional glycosyltransferase family 2 protein/CDP-glycerol:glycerophosphate glycerophosphotransferase [Actinomadura xylanilytica]MDL4773220.1 bifunctional glycosyltransferase family 2 protein/CDP-glycerol:glycerophosphate glycerophosphotransferase [Actinomadura xylanilytica]
MSPELSIVVPFYNVEDYLEECLASLAGQTLTDIEVVMVDDGSPDGSVLIAEEQAARDARFVLVQQENQGLGPARNTGALHATGEYLAFADSDDVVPRYAYERMVGSLKETGSDLVSGDVRVFNAERSKRAKFYGEAFGATRLRTHVTRDRELLHDRTAWNKVFRRTFWDAHGFTFPAGAYEDAPVTLPAHVLAESVDVLREVVYHYRQRQAGERSITQRRTEASNLEDRVASIRSVSGFLREAAPALKDAYDLTTLDDDLSIFIDVAEQGDADYRNRLCAMVGRYLQDVEPALLARLPAIKRLKYHLARENRPADLVAVLEYERTGLPVTPVRTGGLLRRRRYAGHPFRDDPVRAIPDSVYDLTGELRLHAQVDEIAWRPDGVLCLTGHAYIRGLDMTPDDGIEVWLQHARTRRRHRLRVRRAVRPEVTANSGQPAACYDGSGFAVDIDPAALKSVPGWKNADWRLHAAVRVGRGRDRLRLSAPVERCGAAAQWPRLRSLSGRVRVQVVQTDDHGVVLRFRQVKALVTGHRLDGDVLELTGSVTGATSGDDTVTLASRERGTKTTIPVRHDVGDGGATTFRFRLPLAELVPDEPMDDAHDRMHWDLWLHARGRKLRLAASEDLAESAHAVAGREVMLTRTRYGNLTLLEGVPQLMVRDLAWDGDHLVISGEYPVPTATPGPAGPETGEHGAGVPDTGGRAASLPDAPTVPIAPPPVAGASAVPDRLVLRRRRTGVRHAFPLRWAGDARFEARLDLAAITTLAGTLPLASGTWDVQAADASGAEVGVTVRRGCLAGLPPGRDVAAHNYRLWPARGGEGLQLSARVARPDDERGPYAQRLLCEREYPVFLRRPRRDLIVFESYFGWQYSCNPKALYEEFRRRDTGHELVWVMGDQHFRPPSGARTVQRHGREYYEATAAAEIVVNNVAQPTTYRKRIGQLYVQTWHGTPVKSVGFDMNWSRMERRDQRLRELTDDVARWDLLLTQNPFSTETMRRAFRYGGEILETGYPRNDLAHGPDRDRIRARVRARLGLPDGKRAVLYAPTWRDHLQTTSGGLDRHRLGLDLDEAAAALGKDTVLLLRSHHLLNAPIPAGHESFVLDVTRYPDVTELYLAADALVTDYSSAMCDFAGLGKPILLFAHDLDAYRDEIRGLELDLTATPPGPILRTSGELVEALADLDGAGAESSGLLTEFAETFCPHDDGGAAARVVDRLLELTGRHQRIE